MSIKAVTYQGVSNFNSNLYALEVKSRFLDQSAANGYYEGYGEELTPTTLGNVIKIGSGAFLVQGRLNEIDTGGESITVQIQNGYVGYVCARIETYRPNDGKNCTLIVKTGTSLKEITFIRDDTYSRISESENKVYEFPLCSFSMTDGKITDLTKVITPVEEDKATRTIAEAAAKAAEEALEKIRELPTTADLEKLKEELTYEAIKFVSCSLNKTQAQIGSIVSGLTISWKSTKVPTKLYLNGEEQTKPTSKEGTITIPGSYSKLTAYDDPTWTVKIVDEKDASATTSPILNFMYKVFYGESVSAHIDEMGMTDLRSTVLTETRVRNLDFDTGKSSDGTAKYAYYCVPVVLGECSFEYSGGKGGFEPYYTLNYTYNDSTLSYYVYRSTNCGFEKETFKIS